METVWVPLRAERVTGLRETHTPRLPQVWAWVADGLVSTEVARELGWSGLYPKPCRHHGSVHHDGSPRPWLAGDA